MISERSPSILLLAGISAAAALAYLTQETTHAGAAPEERPAVALEMLTVDTHDPLSLTEIAGDGKGEGLQLVAGGGSVPDPDEAARAIDQGIAAYRQGDYRAARRLLAPHLDNASAALNYVRAGHQLDQFDENDLSLLQVLAEQENGAAARMLGDIYRTGEYVPVNRDRAESFYSLAIEMGDKRSLLRLAQFYDEVGDTARAIPAYKNALADFPEKEWRYLYLVAASPEFDDAERSDAAARLDQLAATDIVAARAAFDLYRRHDIPGAGSDNALDAARAAYSHGARELGVYVAAACSECSVDEVESIIQQSTNFDDSRRVATALARMAAAGRSPQVIAVLDDLPSDKAVAVGVPLVKRLGGVSNETVTLAQLRLEEAGLYGGRIDGLLGHKTLAALRQSSKLAGGDLALTSPELFGWVITSPVSPQD